MSSSPSAQPTPEGPGSVSGGPNPPPGFAETFTGLVGDDGTELREGYAEVGDERLHYVEAGDGPLIVLLHGFPEFWGGCRSRRSRRRAFESSPPTYAATTSHRGRPASPPTPPRRLPPTSAVSSENAAPSPRCWSATTGAEPSPGPPR